MKQTLQDLISDLPGTALIQQGLQDYHAKLHTMPSCLVRMARRRLVRAGLIEASSGHDINAELDLYHLLSHEGNQAHSRYNALVRELISFEHPTSNAQHRSEESSAQSSFVPSVSSCSKKNSFTEANKENEGCANLSFSNSKQRNTEVKAKAPREAPSFSSFASVQIKSFLQEATEIDHWRDFQTIRDPIPYKS